MIISWVASARLNMAGDPALAHDEDAVAHAQHLRQLRRDHQDGDALARPARSSAHGSRPWCPRRCRASARPGSGSAASWTATWPARPSAGCRPTARAFLPDGVGPHLHLGGRVKGCLRAPAWRAASRGGHNRASMGRLMLAVMSMGGIRPCSCRSSGTSASPSSMACCGDVMCTGLPSTSIVPLRGRAPRRRSRWPRRSGPRPPARPCPGSRPGAARS